MDNMNIRKINGFTVQLVADGVYAIDEFGIALMYLITEKHRHCCWIQALVQEMYMQL